MKGTGKSRHLPIGTPGSCLTENDRELVHPAPNMSGPECRRCRVRVAPPRTVDVEFTIDTAHPATVLDLARTQAAAAFECITDDPALIVSVATGSPIDDDSGARHSAGWRFLVNASWDTEAGTPSRDNPAERRNRPERRRLPDRRR